MRKKSVIFSIALFVAIIAFILIRRTQMALPLNTIQESAMQAPPFSQPKLKEISARKIPSESLQIPLQKLKTEEESKTCQLYVNTLIDDTDSFLEELKDKDLRSHLKCFPSAMSDVVMKDSTGELLKNCLPNPQTSELNNKKMCRAILSMLRALAIHHGSLDQRDYENMDLSLLANKFYALIADSKNVPLNSGALKEIANALVKQAPGQAFAYKAVILADLSSAKSMQEITQNENVAKALDQALAITPDDANLQDMYLALAAMNKDYDVIRQFAENYPDNPLSYYYRAAGEHYLNNNKDQALVILQEANQKFGEDNPRFGDTIKNIQNGKEQPFSITFGIDFENL